MLSYYALSQNKNDIDIDYGNFKNVFDKEFDVSNTVDSIPVIKNIFDKNNVPGWVLDLPQSNDTIKYCIGISDPGMEKDTAINLAIFRAKVLLGMMSSAQITGISDFYVSGKNDKQRSLYREYYNISSEIYVDNNDFNVVNDTILPDKEAIVLVSWKTAKKEQPERLRLLKANVEVYGKFIGSNKYISSSISRLEALFSLENTGREDTCFHKYLIRKQNKGISIISRYDEYEKIFKNLSLKYFSTNTDNDGKDTCTVSVKLNNGLWNGLFLALIKSLVMEAQNNNVNIKSVSDNLTEGSKNLIRIISTNNVSIKINNPRINNNRLMIDF